MRSVFVLIFAAASAICRAEEPAVGRWEGSIHIPDHELKVIVDLAQAGEAAWMGSIIIPGMDIKGVSLTDIAPKDSALSFSIKSALAEPGGEPAKFTGRLSANDTLSGEFHQAGNSAPFTLHKTGPPQVETPRRSTAVTKELEGEWKGEYQLFGYGRTVTIKLANRGGDGAGAEFVVVGKKTNNLPVDLVTQEGDLLTIDSHETGISYEGRLRDGELKGAFLQGPLEIPLVLRRAK